MSEEMTWQPIETAPKDGTGILVTDGRFVHYGWWKHDYADKWPWAMVDSHSLEPEGCCDNEADDTIQINGWLEHSPTYWMPLPAPPALATASKEGGE